MTKPERMKRLELAAAQLHAVLDYLRAADDDTREALNHLHALMQQAKSSSRKTDP
jgi:hypothetical protein